MRTRELRIRQLRPMTNYLLNNEVTGKGTKESNGGVKLRYYHDVCVEGLRKPTKTSIKIACLRAEIWARNLEFMKQECYPLHHEIHFYRTTRTELQGHYNMATRAVNCVATGSRVSNVAIQQDKRCYTGGKNQRSNLKICTWLVDSVKCINEILYQCHGLCCVRLHCQSLQVL
jgi:hypothetical protein